jgi:UDP-glucose 4-epimerase
MRILLTGVSSFTGYWFAKTMSEAGHEVVGTMTGSGKNYEGVRKRRVELLPNICKLVPDAPFGSDAFIKLLREAQWDLLCHHGTETANYRSQDFDLSNALLKNTLNPRAVLEAFTKSSGKGVVLTGSAFENDESVGNEPLRAFSPYGLSKGLTWQSFRYYCGYAGIPLTKFVIPNAFGPFEEERFTAYLFRTWREGKAAAVKTPLYIRDNIPVDLLARTYRHCLERVAGQQPLAKLNPSGYIESQGAFAQRVAREAKARRNWTCELSLPAQEDFSEPLMRVNNQPARLMFPDWNEKTFWDSFIEFYPS